MALVDDVEFILHYYNQTDVRLRVESLSRLVPAAEEFWLESSSGVVHHRRLSRVEVDEVVGRYLGNETLVSIGEDFGVDRRVLSLVLKREGVEVRYRRLSPDDVVQAERLYGDGLSLASIGERFEVHAGTVRRALIRAGVSLRPVGTNQWS